MMQHYIQYIFKIKDQAQQEILIALLSEIGFDGFEELENELIAYAHQDFNHDALTGILNQHQLNFSKAIIEEQNWNELWESNFQPVVINDAVAVRAHFHQPIKNVQHEIIITPKMSFGTGHHATTYMMIEQLLKINLHNKTVLDFGTGTGLLSILAEKLGAEHITAIDNDEWSINNATENIQQNNCFKIELLMADHPPLEKKFDLLLANINKNIITAHFENLVSLTVPGGSIILSGLLEADEEDLHSLASVYNVYSTDVNRRSKWLLLQFNKPV